MNGTTCYTYDGDGDRVAKTNCNVVNAGNGGTTGILSEYLYDINHRLMTEINVSTQQKARANIYAGSVLLAEDAPDANVTTATATQLRVTDQVGSLRGLLDLGEHVVQTCTSFPYGDGATYSSPADQFFTGKERDAESTLDYFGARHYSSALGRWMSPDYSANSVILELPQSWNKYSYELNRPTYGTDPDGRCPWCVGAIVGGVIEGGVDAYNQLSAPGGNIRNFNLGEFGAHVAGGLSRER